MFFIQLDKLQYSFFLSFGIHLVNNVSDQSQVSISADKSFGFQSRLKTFLVGQFLSGDKKSDKNRPIFFMTHDRFLSADIVGRHYRPIFISRVSWALSSAIALRQLHWLPVKQRIHFKIPTLTYRTLQSGSPSYLLSLINLNNRPRPV